MDRLSKNEQDKLELAFFAKYQQLKNEYMASKGTNNLCGIILLNERPEKSQSLSLGAAQFGNAESLLNTLLVAVCRVTEEYSINDQVVLLERISQMFETRANSLSNID